MSNILHVLDVSPHIYAGNVNKSVSFEGPLENSPEGWYQKHIPTGGISFLFNKVNKFSKRDTMAFAFDRTPTNRLEILPTYKEGRPSPPEITVQKEIAEEILRDCGFNVFAEEGFEADDIIYTLVKDNKDKYDHIFVHTGDSDLYSLVDENVSIAPSSSRAKEVNMHNYETSAMRDRIVYYNGLNVIKMIEGDSSDKIPPLTNKVAIDQLWYMYNTPGIREMGLADPNTLRAFCESHGGDVYRNFQLVYPHEVPGIELDPHKLPDVIRTQAWGKRVGNSQYRYSRVNVPDIEEIVQGFFDRGMAF